MAKPRNEEYEYIGRSYKLVHRHKASLALRRPLKKNEVVHHLDFDKKNNNLNNLMVLKKKDHYKLHGYLNFVYKDMTRKQLIKNTIDWLDEKKIKYILLTSEDKL